MVIFTKHAENKFEILKRHKFLISKKQVIETLDSPDLIDKSRSPLLIAQRKIDNDYILRVVCINRNSETKRLLSFIPAE